MRDRTELLSWPVTLSGSLTFNTNCFAQHKSQRRVVRCFDLGAYELTTPAPLTKVSFRSTALMIDAMSWHITRFCGFWHFQCLWVDFASSPEWFRTPPSLPMLKTEQLRHVMRSSMPRTSGSSSPEWASLNKSPHHHCETG